MSFGKKLCMALLVLVAVSAGIVLAGAAVRRGPSVENGAINLRGQPAGPVVLVGDWDFYWGALIADGAAHTPDARVRLSGDWTGLRLHGQTLPSFGAATYRLKVYAWRGQTLSVSLSPQQTAWRLYADDQLLGGGGQVSLRAEDSRAQNGTGADVATFQAPADVFYLNLQVSNHQVLLAGAHSAVLVGRPSALKLYYALLQMAVGIMVGTCLMVFAFSVLLILQGENRRAVFFFALTILAMLLLLFAAPYSSTGVSAAVFGLRARWVLWTIASSWNGVFFLLYLRYTYPGRASIFLARAVLPVSVVFTCAALVLPLFWVTMTDFVAILFSLAAFLAAICLLIWETRRDSRYAFSLLLGCAAAMPLMANDIFAPSVPGLLPELPLTLLGVLVLLLCVLGMHVRDFAGQLRVNRDLVRRLQQTQRLREEFVARAAGQLRAPVAELFVTAGYLAQGALAPTDEVVAGLRRDSMRVLGLVDDLLFYSRLRAGDLPRRTDAFPFAALVGGVVSEYRYLGQTQGVRLRYEEQPDLPAVRGDRDWTLHALYGILSICLRFASQNDEIVVEAGAGEDAVTLRFFGPGVPAELVEALRRLWDGADVQVPYGLDIGARVIGYVAQQQGGHIAVSVREGGMLLTLSLCPAAPGPAALQPLAAAKPAQASTGRLHLPGTQEWTVLLADSDPASLRDMAGALSPLGFSVEGFGASRAARDWLDGGGRADVAVVRAAMPELSGMELCRYIRARHTLYELPVLLIASDRASVQPALQAGANVCMLDPCDILLLQANISTLMQLRKTAVQAEENENAFLQAQIKPHFLFNALNTIASYNYIDPAKGAELIGELADYLRYTFDVQARGRVVPLADELHFTRAYLLLERARFEERLRFSFDVQDADGMLILPFLIQPLVENAVRHGVLKREDGGCVTVRGRREGAFYRIAVEDDGAGMETSRVAEVLRGEHATGTGVGLQNVKKRLAYSYGEALSIQSAPGRGTTVSFRLPAEQTREEKDDADGDAF